MSIPIVIVVVTIVAIVFAGIGFHSGIDYVADEIIKEIRIRRKMQSPQDILTEVLKICHRVKEKGD